MTDSRSENNFHVPKFIGRTLQGLLLPGEKLKDILDQIGGFISVASDEIGLDETVWGSKIMTLTNKKSKTLDMFIKKVVKTEASDAESNCSATSDDGTVIERPSKMTSCKSSPGSTPQMLSPEKVSKKVLKTEKNLTVTPKNLMPRLNKPKSFQHDVSPSVDESSEKNEGSPSHSVDLFAEETQISSVQPNKTNSEDSSSDTEMITISENHQSPTRCNLDSPDENSITPSYKSNTGKKDSESTRTSFSKQNSHIKSNAQNNSLEKELSEKDEDNEQPAVSKLDSIKKSMKNIKQIYSEVESNTEAFSFEDLTEDDEIYVLQCPTEMDAKKLKGVELTLEGNSVVSVDEQSKYDCFSVKEHSKRHLYLALPDSNEQGMKLGVFPKAGNIILTENLGIPYTEPNEDATLDDCDTYQNKSLGHHASKKKKKHRTSDGSDKFGESVISKENSIGEDTQIIPDSENQETPLKTKKKKKRSMEGKDSSFSNLSKFSSLETDQEESQIILDIEYQETPSKQKKKKKRSMESKENSSSSDLKNVDIRETDCESQIIPDTQDQETPLKVRKKKKKNKGDTTQDEGTESEFFSEGVTDVLNNLASKKKKRKHLSLGNVETKDYESDFDKLLSIKTEMQEPQLVSDFQETPSKSKKRSRKDLEDSEEFPKEEIPKKKKKKKHSNLESSTED